MSLDADAYAREAYLAEGARRERERLLTSLAGELSRYTPTDSTPVVVDNLWGWLLGERARYRP